MAVIIHTDRRCMLYIILKARCCLSFISTYSPSMPPIVRVVGQELTSTSFPTRRHLRYRPFNCVHVFVFVLKTRLITEPIHQSSIIDRQTGKTILAYPNNRKLHPHQSPAHSLHIASSPPIILPVVANRTQTTTTNNQTKFPTQQCPTTK